jgi:H+/Cl- antiporter ClcA
LKPIGLYTFLLGIVVLGLFWLAAKPVYDVVAQIVPGMAGVTDTEKAWFGILPFLIGGLLLVWMIVRLTKRGRGSGE